jgi:hypothetical protein
MVFKSVLDSDECCAKHGNAATLEVVFCLLMGDDLARSYNIYMGEYDDDVFEHLIKDNKKLTNELSL